MAAILRVRDNDGNVYDIKAIAGQPPVKGVDYWTEADKYEIVTEATEAARPVRGVDYWTSYDKSQVVSDAVDAVLLALPVAEEASV